MLLLTQAGKTNTHTLPPHTHPSPHTHSAGYHHCVDLSDCADLNNFQVLLCSLQHWRDHSRSRMWIRLRTLPLLTCVALPPSSAAPSLHPSAAVMSSVPTVPSSPNHRPPKLHHAEPSSALASTPNLLTAPPGMTITNCILDHRPHPHWVTVAM